jgi:hypothetical protein
MVIVLNIGPKVRGFKRDRESCILRAIKIRSIASFRGYVKQSAPCRKILLNVKKTLQSIRKTLRRQKSR